MSLRNAVDDALADDHCLSALRQILADGEHALMLDDNLVKVPAAVPLEIVAKSAHTYRVEMSYGDHVRVLVAVGGLGGVDSGVPRARVCFASMFFTPAGEPISCDFSRLAP